MTVEDNIAVVRRFYAEAINGRDGSACERLLTEGFVHNGEARGRAGQRQAVEAFLSAFDPLHNEIGIVFGADALVCAHQRWTGRHVGPFLGHAATGHPIEFTSTAIRIEGGEIGQAWDEMDAAGLIGQISN